MLLFWYPSWYPGVAPPTEIDRAEYVWLLGLIPLFMAARYVVHRRLFTPTPYDPWFVLFILLAFINVDRAPYPSRGIFMIARPLLGMALVYYLVELTRVRQSLRPALWLVVGVALVVGLMAVGTTQWTEKSIDFLFIIDRLPDLTPLFSVENFIRGGFNPNEIGGAMAWLIPLTYGLIALPGRPRHLQRVSGVAFALLLLALMLGQSRAAIIGVLGALTVMTLLVIPRGRWRNSALVGIILLTVVQSAVLLNVFPDFSGRAGISIEEAGLSARDERTTNQRFDIWASAQAMVTDYPLTGVGMSLFRYNQVRNDYPIPNFDFPANPNVTNFQRRLVPHAHNEFVQITTDLGLPGLVVFTAWNVIAAGMLWVVWRKGDHAAQVVAVAVGSGLVAHAVYGLADAIPLWDRFNFIYWLMLGLAAAQYIHHQFTASRV